jgi:hypothetical protein
VRNSPSAVGVGVGVGDRCPSAMWRGRTYNPPREAKTATRKIRLLWTKAAYEEGRG